MVHNTDELRARARFHAANSTMDPHIYGLGGAGMFSGCAVGCLTTSETAVKSNAFVMGRSHRGLAEEFGIPYAVSMRLEGLFMRSGTARARRQLMLDFANSLQDGMVLGDNPPGTGPFARARFLRWCRKHKPEMVEVSY